MSGLIVVGKSEKFLALARDTCFDKVSTAASKKLAIWQKGKCSNPDNFKNLNCPHFYFIPLSVAKIGCKQSQTQPNFGYQLQSDELSAPFFGTFGVTAFQCIQTPKLMNWGLQVCGEWYSYLSLVGAIIWVSSQRYNDLGTIPPVCRVNRWYHHHYS